MMSRRIARRSGIFRPRRGELSGVVGWAKRSVPTMSREWWARRIRAFAHPTRNQLLRRQNRPLDLAEADAVTVALAPAAHRERVAIFQERALDTAVELHRLRAVP